NDLPLSLVISWFEQKAVAVLLTLLYLGVQNITLGPALPAFISPNVMNILVEKYGLKGIGSDAEADANAAMALS
ncbi:MAG TPA: hydroxylamine reductase, partial [Candidatus Hydrogenedentes bacterium]|nr:hydroxylamine reductase [Candidatus Hydrogenedentota bacterium]